MKTYTVKKEVTAEQVNDIMDSAMTGMGYWADEAKLGGVNHQTSPVNYVSEALTAGLMIRIHDSEEEKWHNLTLKKFLKGLSLSNNFDFEEFDMYDAERVVQLALFGEVVYG